MHDPHGVLLEEDDNVATIHIDDGKVNALSHELITALSNALDAAIANGKAALILGREGCLCAGFDLAVMRADLEARKSLVLAGLELALKIFEAPIPVIVGCTGHAIAAGTLLLLSADQVIAPRASLKIGFNETTIGIEISPFVFELARYRLLPSACNQILRGSLYDAEGALRAGYVDELVSPAELLGRARDVASEMAQFESQSFGRTKAALRSRVGATLRSELGRRRRA